MHRGGTMRRVQLKFLVLLVVAGTLLPLTGASAQARVTPARTPSARAAADVPKIDTAAVNALKRMGAYLRTLQSFQIDANITSDEVARDGQLLTNQSHVELVAARPNRMRVELNSDRKERLFVYDGKTFTLFAPRQKFYSVVDAPPTINELATLL